MSMTSKRMALGALVSGVVAALAVAASATAQKGPYHDPRDWIRADDLNASVNAEVAANANEFYAERDAAANARARYEADMNAHRRITAMTQSARAALEGGNTTRACELYRSALAIDAEVARTYFYRTIEWVNEYC